MSPTRAPRRCPLCQGTKTEGRTTFATDLGEAVIVVRDVPATVCSQCGEEWLADETVVALEKIVAQAKARKTTVEVVGF